jgi:dTDP-4-amino-4,6-dideoxygalactose transaminase
MIRFIRPTIPPPAEWLPYLRPAYESRRFTNFGPVAMRFEDALTAKYGGADRQAVAVSSCTTGLVTALAALGIRGRVIVPSFTFPATVQAVLQAGCEPVLCDISLATWELDPEQLDERLRRGNVAAVVHVRSFGFCHDLSPIEAIAFRHGVPLLVDAAAALGGSLSSGAWAGGHGEMEVFSLHSTKVFGIGEGGVILARGEHVAALRRASNFGIDGGDVTGWGLNAKLSEFHAAIGLAVLDHIDEFTERRRAIAAAFGSALEGCSQLTRAPAAGRPPTQTFPVLAVTAAVAEGLVAASHERGVELRRYYRPALHQTTLLTTAERDDLENSAALAERVVCLPVYSDMAAAESERVIEVVRASLQGRSP